MKRVHWCNWNYQWACDGKNEAHRAKACTEIVALMDPTGVATIAAAFMHSTCEGFD